MSWPVSPTNGSTTTVNGILYVYNSTSGSWSPTASSATDFNVGNITATGNISSSNESPSGNLSVGGNLTVTGSGTITGNITTSAYFKGDGGLLTNLASGGASIVNGNSNVTIAANANVNISSNGVANVVQISGNAVTITGNLTATNINATSNMTVNNAPLATTGKAIAMAMIFGG